MPKGPEKNTKNKALHTKLLNRKKAKLQEEKKEKALRLKTLITKINQKKNNGNSNLTAKSLKNNLLHNAISAILLIKITVFLHFNINNVKNIDNYITEFMHCKANLVIINF
ncbi:hypothetical protein [Flavobacterium aestuarii]|uniref:hypothetical protein n=1 Tax=Flavobacterium aestuarii TaxID=3149227 RepID=UPI0032B5FEC7